MRFSQERRAGSMLACEGCHNELPKGGWLKATEVYSQSLGVRGLKSEHQQGRACLQWIRNNPSRPLPAFGGWLSWALFFMVP